MFKIFQDTFYKYVQNVGLFDALFAQVKYYISKEIGHFL